MPVYDYHCSQCHGKFEMSKSMEKRHTARCPKCNMEGGLVMSAFSFKLTGYSSFIDRIDDHQKRQADKGERSTLPHPSEVM